MNSVEFVHGNSTLWWITHSWAEGEQSKNNLGKEVSSRDAGEGASHLLGNNCPCSKGGRTVWYLTGRANASLQVTLVGSIRNSCIRWNCGWVDLFNQAHRLPEILMQEMLLYFLAEAWVDAFNLNLVGRPETGNQGEVNEKNLFLKAEGGREILVSLDWSLEATTLSSS